ncbi:MAG: sugar phosphate isomerase/epimerase [Clostridia bacterium]|nr:sugar phosphate isomerase/epimerase [Clostridia bacterium]
MQKIAKIGVQLYTIREFTTTEQDIRESFRKIKALGYDQAQTAGCKISYELFGQIARDEGIEIVGTHDNFEEMCDDFETSLKKHQFLGTNIMGIGGCPIYDLKGYEEFFRKANEIGEKLIPYGGKFTYHNHHYEFTKLENGKTAMQHLMDNLNPKTTSFVLDTHWVQRGGGDVCAWIKKLSGRIDILHLKDFMMERRGKDFQPMYCEIGNGNMNWDGIIEAAFEAGVRYYVVEQDSCPGDPFKSLEISSEFLHKHYM